MAAALAEFSRSLRVIALLDRDTQARQIENVAFLPVSMIENFLLDPDVIFEAIESVRDRTTLRTIDDVSAALDAVLTAHELPEVGRRVAALLPPLHFHPGSDVGTIRARAVAFSKGVLTQYSEERIAQARAAAETAVEGLRRNLRRREEFDGKKVLTAFFREHLAASTLSRPVFAFYAARRARRRRSVLEFFDGFFEAQQLMTRHQGPQG
jgi:hypothetical protein